MIINYFQFTVSYVTEKYNVVANCLLQLFEETDQLPYKPRHFNVKTISPNYPNQFKIQMLCKLPEVFQDIKQHHQSDG